jgi:hypothetical protein
MNMKEFDTLTKALNELERNTGIAARDIKHEPHHALYAADLKLAAHEFAVEIKGVITRANAGGAIYHIKTAKKPKAPLLIADYINPKIATVLRAEEVNYLDTVGNAYIKVKGMFVLIQGNKAPTKPTIQANQAFTPTGLKIIYALLVKPDLLNATYRDIAEAANVALGAVGWALNDLKARGYIVERINNKQRHWNTETKPNLIDKWVEAYPKLKQKYLINRYTTTDPDWWKKANINQYGGLFAGEIAANKYTQYLKPQDHLIYINKENINAFLNDFRLGITKDQNTRTTRVDVVEKFWGATLGTNPDNVTTPLLTYADLLASGDIRNREVAQMIRENEIES